MTDLVLRDIDPVLAERIRKAGHTLAARAMTRPMVRGRPGEFIMP